MPLTYSKAVRSGDVVSWRAGKIVRCGRLMKPYGVYQDKNSMVIVTDDGPQNWTIPRGIVVYGAATTVTVK